ncbi:unnamed protein product [Caenorhabditis brenneri]
MDAPRFPLMRLPVACFQNVLRVMEPIQLFKISLASKKTKGLVQSLKIKATEFVVYIGDVIFFSIRLSIPCRGTLIRNIIYTEEIYYKFYSNIMDRKTFINHVKYIFNTEKITIEFGHGSRNFDFEALLKGRQDVERVSIIDDNQEEIRRILNFMKPSIVSMDNVREPRDILIQNIDYLCATYMIICLDDLLISNIRQIESGCSMFPPKVFNRFLKLWMRGSNPQLESLQLNSLAYRMGVPADGEIFDGMEKTQNTTVRYFKSGSGTLLIFGGTNIFRFDGTMATILVHKRGRNTIDFEMFVWHEHCIAKETKCFEFSLASKKTKELAQSLKIKVVELIVCIYTEFFSIRLSFPFQEACFKYLINIWDIYTNYEDVSYSHYSSIMDGNTFINHLKFIFNTEKIKVDFGSNIENIDFEPLLKGRQDVENIRLLTDNQEERRRILSFMNPSMVAMVTITRPTDVLIQHFNYLRVGRMEICLDDLLVLNSRSFDTRCQTVTTKVLNRFLKMWTRGSNLQLERLTLCFHVGQDFKKEEIFDRLKTTQNNTTRYFKSASGTRKIGGLWPNRALLEYWRDIVRFDGTKATIRVFHCRHIQFELFEISLASKKTKNLVQSLRIKASRFTVRIDYRPFSIRLGLPYRVPANREFRTIWDRRPEYKNFYYTKYSNQMDEKTFIDHLKFIFHTEKITIVFGYNSKLFDFEPILQGRQDIESIELMTNDQEEDRRILNIMKPSQAHIFNFTGLRDILIQNFNYLYADHEIIRLEDLLVSNVRNFEAYCSRVPTKVLNRFLKLWTRGSNLQLESLELSFPINNDFSEEEILAGLKITSNNTVRYFKLVSGSRRILQVMSAIDASRFPLMRLPVACSQVVLRILIPNELIAISLLSKKCKYLVQSIGIKSQPTKCRIARSIQIAVCFNGTSRLFLEFNITDVENGKYVLKKPSETVEFRFRRNDLELTRYILSGNHMEVREWLEHLQFLFGCSKTIDILFAEQSFEFNIDSLKETFQNVCKLVLLHSGCYCFNKLVLRKFLQMEILGVSPSCFQNSRIPRDLLIQNIQTIWVSRKTDDEQLSHLKLNDWLMMNSRVLGIFNLQKSLKEFNMFLKLWTKGSNPNLEYITFRYLNWNVEDANTLMKGIKNQTMPRTLARAHRSVNWIAYGGRDIQRYDGVKATVHFGKTMDGQATVIMLVWHDHCFVA